MHVDLLTLSESRKISASNNNNNKQNKMKKYYNGISYFYVLNLDIQASTAKEKRRKEKKKRNKIKYSSKIRATGRLRHSVEHLLQKNVRESTLIAVIGWRDWAGKRNGARSPADTRVTRSI